MIEVRQTEIFSKWLRALRDRRARVRIQARIDRFEAGNSGDIKPVGGGVLGNAYRLWAGLPSIFC